MPFESSYEPSLCGRLVQTADSSVTENLFASAIVIPILAAQEFIVGRDYRRCHFELNIREAVGQCFFDG